MSKNSDDDNKTHDSSDSQRWFDSGGILAPPKSDLILIEYPGVSLWAFNPTKGIIYIYFWSYIGLRCKGQRY